MSFYEYECRECGAFFTITVDKQIECNDLHCPECNANKPEWLLSIHSSCDVELNPGEPATTIVDPG